MFVPVLRGGGEGSTLHQIRHSTSVTAARRHLASDRVAASPPKYTFFKRIFTATRIPHQRYYSAPLGECIDDVGARAGLCRRTGVQSGPQKGCGMVRSAPRARVSSHVTPHIFPRISPQARLALTPGGNYGQLFVWPFITNQPEIRFG